jgi:hypothetical protein
LEIAASIEDYLGENMLIYGL